MKVVAAGAVLPLVGSQDDAVCVEVGEEGRADRYSGVESLGGRARESMGDGCLRSISKCRRCRLQ